MNTGFIPPDLSLLSVAPSCCGEQALFYRPFGKNKRKSPDHHYQSLQSFLFRQGAVQFAFIKAVSYLVRKWCFASSLWKSGFLILTLAACPENSCEMFYQNVAFMVFHMENKLLLSGCVMQVVMVWAWNFADDLCLASIFGCNLFNYINAKKYFNLIL